MEEKKIQKHNENKKKKPDRRIFFVTIFVLLVGFLIYWFYYYSLLAKEDFEKYCTEKYSKIYVCQMTFDDSVIVSNIEFYCNRIGLEIIHPRDHQILCYDSSSYNDDDLGKKFLIPYCTEANFCWE